VVLAHPVIPQSTQTIWRQLGLPGAIESQRLDALAWGGLTSGTKIGEFAPVFPRVDHKEAFERMEAMEQEMNQAAKAGSAAAEQKATQRHTGQRSVRAGKRSGNRASANGCNVNRERPRCWHVRCRHNAHGSDAGSPRKSGEDRN